MKKKLDKAAVPSKKTIRELCQQIGQTLNHASWDEVTDKSAEQEAKKLRKLLWLRLKSQIKDLS